MVNIMNLKQRIFKTNTYVLKFIYSLLLFFFLVIVSRYGIMYFKLLFHFSSSLGKY